MKNLANCTPREFLRQTNKIRKAVSNWLTLTKVMDIRKRLPRIPDDATEEQKDALIEAQVKDNINAVLDVIMDEHPDETADLMGLMCFIEPEDLDNHSMSEILGSVAEMLNCQDVLDFFISLARLGNVHIFAAAKQ